MGSRRRARSPLSSPTAGSYAVTSRALDAAPARPDASSQRLLTLVTDPPEAEVWLEGKRLGVTPLVSHSIPAGASRLQIRRRGFVTASRQLPAASAHPRLEVKLAPRAAVSPASGTGAGSAEAQP